jgi:hypothetical protein
MKATCLIAGSLLMLAGCGSVDSADSKLSGIYTDGDTTAVSVVLDTVELKPLPGKNMYQVYYRNSIERTIDGKKIPTEFNKLPPVIGSYDPEKKVIVIEGEPEYAVDINAHTLTKGNGVFKKIK